MARPHLASEARRTVTDQACSPAPAGIIADLPAKWPLDLEDKGKVGQFFALQHLRGAAFREWHDQRVAAMLDEVRANPGAALQPHPGRTTSEVIQELEGAVTSDTYRLTKMLKLVRSVGIVFASMHWTLLRFDRGRLATSDHPVVVWPVGGDSKRKPGANDLDAGVIETLEVFAPIGPTHLLLMTWRDEKSICPPIAGMGRHLATANAFVIANAHTQWFHEPNVEPWVAQGRRSPIAPQLLRGYGESDAQSSHRRAKARDLANAEANRDVSNDPVQVVGEEALPPPTNGE